MDQLRLKLIERLASMLSSEEAEITCKSSLLLLRCCSSQDELKEILIQVFLPPLAKN
jgi:hypothetical protein